MTLHRTNMIEPQIQPWQVCIRQVALPSSSSDTTLASLYSPGGTSIIIIRYNLGKFVFSRWHFHHHHHQIQPWQVCILQVALPSSSSDTTLASLCSPGGTSIIRYNLGKFVFSRWHFHHHQIQPWQVCIRQVALPSSSSDTTLASLCSPGGTSIIIIIRYNLGKFVFSRWHVHHHHHQIQPWQLCIRQVALPSSSDTTLASLCSPGGTSIIIIIRYNLGKFVFSRWSFHHHHHQIQPWQVCIRQVALPSSSSSDTTLASLYSPGGTSIIIIRYNLGKFVFSRWHVHHHHHQIQPWQLCIRQVALPSSSDTT